jgi:hypothetical protein
MLRAAQSTLVANDRGGYTVPSANLYPFQWNWDAAVNALGWQTFDEPRAWQEIATLLLGQWTNGMVPHIVFHRPESSYFPGPNEWGCDHLTPPTSSISQPPLLTTMVALMRQRSAMNDVDDLVCRLLPKLFEMHEWWYRERDPETTGLVVSYHPWESGCDNSPAWDDPLSAVPPAGRRYERKDTGQIDSSQRPSQHDYDRFVFLMDFVRDCQFDAQTLYRDCPYKVIDIGINLILLRANRDLASLCNRYGLERQGRQALDWVRLTHGAIRRDLWSNRIGQYASKDARTGDLLERRTNAGLLAWYARLFSSEPDVERATVALRTLDDWLRAAPYAVPSTHPEDPAFDAGRYWRGPVWPHINWLIAEGLFHSGHVSRAQRLKEDLLRLVHRAGFFEYFSPETGDGLGGADFSWTAAITLLWGGPGSPIET